MIYFYLFVTENTFTIKKKVSANNKLNQDGQFVLCSFLKILMIHDILYYNNHNHYFFVNTIRTKLNLNILKKLLKLNSLLWYLI